MIIDRKTILAVILADFFVMFGAVFIMWDRIQLAQARMPVAMAMPMPAPIPTPAVKPEIPQPAPVENQSPAANPTDSAPLTAIPDNTNTTALSSPEETSAS